MSAPSASFSSPSATTLRRLVSPVSTSTRTSNPRWPISCSRIALPAASASGDASAASRSARSAASEPRAAATSAASEADRSAEPPRFGARSRSSRAGPVVATGRAVATRAGRRDAAGGRRGAGGRSPRGWSSRRPVVARAVVAARAAVGAAVVPRPVVARSARAAGAAATAAAASRFGAAPPSADRGAATIRAGSAPMPRTPRLPGVRISKSRSLSSAPNSSRASLSASSTDLPVNSWYSLMSASSPSSALAAPLAVADRRCRPWSSCRRRSGWPHACSDRVVVASHRESRGVVGGEAAASSRRTGTCRPSP